MKIGLKAILMLMMISTVVYAGMVLYVYANSFNDSNLIVCYAARKCDPPAPSSIWYTPEELGIVRIDRMSAKDLSIGVDTTKEPFPLQEKTPIFKFEGEFYKVSSLWVTFASGGLEQSWPVPTGLILGAGWIFIGTLFIKRRTQD
jgi:hypothetical protein